MIAMVLAALVAAAPVAETVYEPLTGLAGGWHDFGWSPHTLEKGRPATVDFSGYGGWILYKPLDARFGALRLRLRAPAGFGSFLAVRLESPSRKLPEIALAEKDGHPGPDGFTEFEIPFDRLDPAAVPFEKLVLRAVREVPPGRVAIGGIWLVGAPAAPREEYASFAGPQRQVRLSIDCSAPAQPISPLIYGVGFGIPRQGEEEHLKALGAAARRWGGNPSSRYNWRLGNAWNTGSDWFFQNTDYHVPPGDAWRTFLDEDRSLGLASALTVPMLGWVAKDTKTPSFPVSLFGPQHAVAPENHDAGDGRGLSGNELPSLAPQRTSVAMPPSGIEAWVRAIGGRGVDMYILDNEPALWSSTHRDVHPDPLTYDELLERMLTYGAAVRRADPRAVIAGPAEWGWPNFFYSAADLKSHLHTDRLRHGNKPLLPWLLGKIREHEKRTGTRILDVLDVHWYPQFKGAGVQLQGDTSPEVAARRIRATRSLWDPSYRDESWIDDNVELIPRLRKWIDENAPGVGISIGEWNFGAESHQSGGLAVAEVLGRFGTLGVTSAFYWTDPPAGTPAFEAFRAYRNYDGKGARFPDWSVPAHSLDTLVSVFAARSEDRRKLVAVVLDLDPAAGAAAQLYFPGCGDVQRVRAFGYAEGSRALHEVPAPRLQGASLEEKLPPYSITVLELDLAAPARP